ncbi:uncharacterized protein CTRU02_214943 [Colletotrichum truncatum]|uniref:Uncharacterized protein n=1 Tax=Colletotrichum truncatum TaxID=5467 RepID=A0ACC3YE30_COLTU|nr:uncharacterized protein CTRU02_08305 [Colletotrichum truncatum]KAF6790176.1 hypothetical protein CTRU02_08305 [Colletotrichum truncatum]
MASVSAVTVSDGGLSTVTLSKKSIRREVDIVAGVTMKERNKQSLTICVVREESVRKLEMACKYIRGLFERDSPPMAYTSVALLQQTIDAAELSGKHRVLNLLFSPEIEDVTFDVPSHFSHLKILRCAAKGDKGRLFVDGSSTYNNVRLDKWQQHRHKNHTLIVGDERGVRIKLNDIVSLPHWARCRSNFDESEQQELFQQFEKLSDKTAWDNIKGVVSTILGIAVGAVKFGVRFNGSAGGIYVKYTFGMHAIELGAAGAKVSAVATAAGSAVVLGVAAAAAVYFIPWDSLFAWLKGAFSSFWDKIRKLWQQFKGWVVELFTKESEHEVNQQKMLVKAA